jgi:predicted DNA-binding protein
MAQSATLHVKLSPEIDNRLRELASARKTSKGQLVREAIAVCYQAVLEDLPLRQQQALMAYQGGFISIGKLAKVMGMHVLVLRTWLNEHGVQQNSVFGSNDTRNA